MIKKKDFFPHVIKLVESGFTIAQAVDQLETNTTTFYDSLTKDQKMQLKQIKTANRGIVYKLRTYDAIDTKDLHEFFTNEY